MKTKKRKTPRKTRPNTKAKASKRDEQRRWDRYWQLIAVSGSLVPGPVLDELLVLAGELGRDVVADSITAMNPAD